MDGELEALARKEKVAEEDTLVRPVKLAAAVPDCTTVALAQCDVSPLADALPDTLVECDVIGEAVAHALTALEPLALLDAKAVDDVSTVPVVLAVGTPVCDVSGDCDALADARAVADAVRMALELAVIDADAFDVEETAPVTDPPGDCEARPVELSDPLCDAVVDTERVFAPLADELGVDRGEDELDTDPVAERDGRADCEDVDVVSVEAVATLDVLALPLIVAHADEDADTLDDALVAAEPLFDALAQPEGEPRALTEEDDEADTSAESVVVDVVETAPVELVETVDDRGAESVPDDVCETSALAVRAPVGDVDGETDALAVEDCETRALAVPASVLVPTTVVDGDALSSVDADGRSDGKPDPEPDREAADDALAHAVALGEDVAADDCEADEEMDGDQLAGADADVERVPDTEPVDDLDASTEREGVRVDARDTVTLGDGETGALPLPRGVVEPAREGEADADSDGVVAAERDMVSDAAVDGETAELGVTATVAVVAPDADEEEVLEGDTALVSVDSREREGVGVVEGGIDAALVAVTCGESEAPTDAVCPGEEDGDSVPNALADAVVHDDALTFALPDSRGDSEVD